MARKVGFPDIKPPEALAIPVVDSPPVAPVDTDQMAFLRKALNAPSLTEVQELITKEILEYNMLNKIELTKDGVTTTLPDEPRHFLFPEILTAVDAGISSALIGPAGSGKSTVCEQIATALGLKYYLQNSVSGDHQLAGYMDAHGRYQTTAFRDCFEKGGLILIDEVDTSDAGALKWVNTALANRHAMFPDKPDPVRCHADFRIIIAANTFGNGADRMYVGANQLDASTLDRFVFFDFHYDEKLEMVLSGNASWTRRVQSLRRGAAKEKARIVISPRASITGAKLLAKGWKQDIVEQRVIWKGIDTELMARIKKAA
jgi:cobaltochelatase CobS